MVPATKKVKTAYQWFQSENLKKAKQELGEGASLGAATSKISSWWKLLSSEERAVYEEKEAVDRARFERESLASSESLVRQQDDRRRSSTDNNIEEPFSRSAKAKFSKVSSGGNSKTKSANPEKEEERRFQKEARELAASDRRRQKAAEEKAVADRHKKLDKTAELKKAQRLEYLLQQSSIFAKLNMGHKKQDAGTTQSQVHHRASNKKAEKGVKPSKSKKSVEVDEDDEEGDGQEEEEEEQMVFLTKQPSCIKFGTLKPYQIESLNWMIHLAQKGLNGILADEMGLGKTLQSISILAYHYEYMKIQGPHLICVPKSTLSNWMNELKRWCPALRAIKFHGVKEDRQHIIDTCFTNAAAAHDGRRPDKQFLNRETGEMEDDNTENPRPWDVCVTTYEVCNTEKRSLGKFAWKYLIIDEAHRLKNEASLFSTTVRAFSTAHRLLLTGTPLQNNLHELWALLNFLLPDIFSSSEQFDEWFNLEIDDEDAKKEMISQLHKILRPFMLRRLKSDVAKGLPPKTETLVMVGMSKMQKQLYKKLLLRDIDSITGNSSSKNKTAILNIVMQLRKCCGHPYLFEGVEDRTLDPLGEHLIENCGKLVVVDRLLKKLKERGSRVLIFTQMTRILDILEDFMVMRRYQYCRIDGNTDYDTREEMIDTFNREGSDKFCFILSTRAGGLGINLQTADICILYDSDWNPQADLQAQDRCHRIGQKKPVCVYRMVTENTVEEKIVERAQQKLKLDAMVVQSGRLKEKDKLSKDDIMNAVRFGADAVFRSEESTITDEDIDAILERGRAKTKEMTDKIQKAEKGDLLDFRMDGGISAQTFEGVDYSDKALRDQLKLLAAESIGKRERKPLTNYNPILAPKKSMIVNNTKIKLPKSLRLPRMEDHQFYNRDRLLELADMEFQTYAALREMGQLPSKEYVEQARTLLPPEYAEEKLALLNEGFGHWTRSQYFHFAKACAKFGREDIASISADMDLPVELVAAYSVAFWKYGPTELPEKEWERVKNSVEKGEVKIARRKKQSALLEKFVNTFNDPRRHMTFANKGTVHFALEQDRALLCAVDKRGYGNWEEVREEIMNDPILQFSHTVQAMSIDLVTKRCDYRIRQMEKEVEAREKKIRSEKPPVVISAEAAVEAIKEVESWEAKSMFKQIVGENALPKEALSTEARSSLDDRLRDKQQVIDRLRELEVQVRGCLDLAEETKQGILRGDQYVNYSSITLKAGGPHTVGDDGTPPALDVEKGVLVEGRINQDVLKVPECGQCRYCLEPGWARKLCMDRLLVRKKLIKIALEDPNIARLARAKRKLASIEGTKEKEVMNKFMYAGKKKGPKPKTRDSTGSVASGGSKKSTKLFGEGAARSNSLGNKRMAVPEELLPDLCRRIGAQGTNKRMQVITEFARDNPSTSIRQVTFKFSELVTRDLPPCVPAPEKRAGRAISFFLRPRFYFYLPPEERPSDWEKYAKIDERAWQEECEASVKLKFAKKQQVKELMEEATVKSQFSEEGDSMLDISSMISGDTGGFLVHEDVDRDNESDGGEGDETEDELEPSKSKKRIHRDEM